MALRMARPGSRHGIAGRGHSCVLLGKAHLSWTRHKAYDFTVWVTKSSEFQASPTYLAAVDDAPNSYLVSDAELEDDPPELVIQHYPVPVAVDHLNKKRVLNRIVSIKKFKNTQKNTQEKAGNRLHKPAPHDYCNLVHGVSSRI